MRPRPAVRVFRMLRWAAALAVLAYVVWFLLRNKSQLASLRNLSAPLLAVLFLVTILNNLLYIFRFRHVVRKKTGLQIPFRSWVRFFLISRLFSLMAGQTGNLYRAWVFKKEYSVSIAKFLASALFITWLDTCLFLLFGAVVIAAAAPHLEVLGINAALLILAVLVCFVVVPLLLGKLLGSVHLSGRLSGWAHRRFLELSSAILTGLKDPVFLLILSSGGFLSFLFSAAVIFGCFYGLGLPIDPSGVALFLAVLGLCNRIVITPGGNLGIKELAYGFLAEQLHIGMAEGILVSLLSRIITMVVTIGLGLAAGGWHLIKHPPDGSSANSTPGSSSV